MAEPQRKEDAAPQLEVVPGDDNGQVMSEGELQALMSDMQADAPATPTAAPVDFGSDDGTVMSNDEVAALLSQMNGENAPAPAPAPAPKPAVPANPYAALDALAAQLQQEATEGPVERFGEPAEPFATPTPTAPPAEPAATAAPAPEAAPEPAQAAAPEPAPEEPAPAAAPASAPAAEAAQPAAPKAEPSRGRTITLPAFTASPWFLRGALALALAGALGFAAMAYMQKPATPDPKAAKTSGDAHGEATGDTTGDEAEETTDEAKGSKGDHGASSHAEEEPTADKTIDDKVIDDHASEGHAEKPSAAKKPPEDDHGDAGAKDPHAAKTDGHKPKAAAHGGDDHAKADKPKADAHGKAAKPKADAHAKGGHGDEGHAKPGEAVSTHALAGGGSIEVSVRRIEKSQLDMAKRQTKTEQTLQELVNQVARLRRTVVGRRRAARPVRRSQPAKVAPSIRVYDEQGHLIKAPTARAPGSKVPGSKVPGSSGHAANHH